MLLPGTELYSQRATFNMKEEPIGEYSIPIVTSSGTFSRSVWMKMDEIAKSLGENGRM